GSEGRCRLAAGQAASAQGLGRAAGLCGDDDERGARGGSRSGPAQAQVMRRLCLLPILALAACSGAGKAPRVAEGKAHIACALGAGEKFAPVCAVERTSQGDAKVLVVHHPDGGFRRFLVLTDGRGLAAADGADEARLAMADGLLEVRVAGDSYRFPFTQ